MSNASLNVPSARVLVVDDDPDALVLLGKLLSMIGVEAFPVTTCAHARQACALGRFTLVICDRLLPDGDGLSLCRELKQQYGCRTIITSGMEPPAATPAAQSVVDAWIEKPVEVKRLHRAVGQLLGG